MNPVSEIDHSSLSLAPGFSRVSGYRAQRTVSTVCFWLVLLALCLASAAPSHAAAPALQTRHVLLVMVDGVRWQEVFTGAEEQLISKEHGGITKTNDLRKAFWRDTPEARREVLMPFFWSTLAKQGQLYGNQHKGSTATSRTAGTSPTPATARFSAASPTRALTATRRSRTRTSRCPSG